MRALVLLITFAAAAPGAELARWEPGGTAGGLSVEPGATLPANPDYFRRAAFLVRMEKPLAAPAWLTVAYLDRGYGLIGISAPVAQRDQWGVARLNTGRVRRAAFRLPAGTFAEPLQIAGLRSLRSLALTETAPPRDPDPPAAPALAFSRPSQRVTTAGADAATPGGLPGALATMRNLLPLARALGFNGIESYVKWDFVERAPGVFDWSFYDAVVDEVERHGMQWFPLLIVGSAYTLPAWYHDSPDNIGFECLEHGLRNDIQSIFAGTQDRYVRRFLAEFGKHYGGRKALLGIRLGPSGNYGEAQYPARGEWGYRGQPIHTHIGYWAGGPHAVAAYRAWLAARYPGGGPFDDARPFLPITARTPRQRLDFTTWYMDAMSAWCGKWAEWAREAMPAAVIHQSSGGWGAVEIGTDYSHQARVMARLKGGVRLTNESDNFPQNFAITRMASSAARFYGAALGYEPGGFGSMRGVVARLFNCVTNGGEHLFYYHSNLYDNDQAIDAWLRYAPLLDRRAPPATDIAVFYPDTAIKLDDEAIRYLWASAFLSRAEALRSAADYDYVSEQMVLDGALDRYRALVFVWGHVTEKPVLDRIDRWVHAGGTLIYPERPRGPLVTVEGDSSTWQRWKAGRTAQGKVVFFPGDPEPGEPYARFVRDELRRVAALRPAVRDALRMEKPASVYWSVLEDGALFLLNFGDDPAEVRLAGGAVVHLPPYSIMTRRN